MSERLVHCKAVIESEESKASTQTEGEIPEINPEIESMSSI